VPPAPRGADRLTAPGAVGETSAALDRAASELRQAKAPDSVVEGLRALRGQVGEPCVVAVVGQVNAGKSTFINALLGEDKAIVGSTETTATINHFVYGRPDPDRPVRCYWRGGRVTEESSEFLASLQGNDLETLRRAEGIDRLEYLVPSPLLRNVTLVDTPGRGAVVGEHEGRAAAFLEVERRLRERHDSETARIHEAADAIVHLVGAVARTSDQELLERFAETGTEARAMNALGVIAKVDLSAEMLARRHELAAKVHGQLEAQLNDVVPVSAALSRALDRFSADGGAPLRRLIDVTRRIPPAQLDLLLQSQELFCEYDLEGCDVQAVERRRLWDDADCAWRVFATILAEARRGGTPQEITARLRDLAGFERLHGTLRDHFFERADTLRCHRIVRDARTLTKRAWFGDVLALRRSARGEQARLDRFLDFVNRAPGDSQIRRELETFIRTQLDHTQRVGALESAWKRVDLDLARLGRRLGEYDADFAALRDLEAAPSSFSGREADELRALLGMYGTEPSRRLDGELDAAACVTRQLHWRVTRDRAPRGSRRWAVADRAHARLGLILEDLQAA
jgi:Dynamin family